MADNAKRKSMETENDTETPRTVLEKYIANAKTVMDSEVPKKRRRVIHTPSPSVIQKGLEVTQRMNNIEKFTPRVVLEDLSKHMKTGSPSMPPPRSRPQRRSLPAIRSIYDDQATPISTLMALQQNGEDETPVQRERRAPKSPEIKRRRTRSLQEIPPDDIVLPDSWKGSMMEDSFAQPLGSGRVPKRHFPAVRDKVHLTDISRAESPKHQLKVGKNVTDLSKTKQSMLNLSKAGLNTSWFQDSFVDVPVNRSMPLRQFPARRKELHLSYVADKSSTPTSMLESISSRHSLPGEVSDSDLGSRASGGEGETSIDNNLESMASGGEGETSIDNNLGSMASEGESESSIDIHLGSRTSKGEGETPLNNDLGSRSVEREGHRSVYKEKSRLGNKTMEMIAELEVDVGDGLEKTAEVGDADHDVGGRNASDEVSDDGSHGDVRENYNVNQTADESVDDEIDDNINANKEIEESERHADIDDYVSDSDDNVSTDYDNVIDIVHKDVSKGNVDDASVDEIRTASAKAVMVESIREEETGKHDNADEDADVDASVDDAGSGDEENDDAGDNEKDKSDKSDFDNNDGDDEMADDEFDEENLPPAKKNFLGRKSLTAASVASPAQIDEVSELDVSPIIPSRRSLVVPTPSRVKKNISELSKSASKPTPPKPTRVRKSRNSMACTLPPAVVKKTFAHFSHMRLHKDALPELMKATDRFFEQVSNDLEAFCHHAGRKTIDETDVELLMERQRFITKKKPLNVLIENYLPLEYRQQLIPCAKAGNKVVP